MTTPLGLRFVLSAGRVTDLPPVSAEVAIAGRSNVGKSSLINALTNRRDLARVSNRPGRTQLLNFFEMDGGGGVVDMPGYGYAAVPGRVRSTWPAMINGYLLGRDGLVLVVVLVDGEVGPTRLDLQMIEWLQANDRAFTLVATKHDKVKPSQRAKRKKDLAEACGAAPSEVLWVSAAKGTGIDTLRVRFRGWLGGAPPEGL